MKKRFLMMLSVVAVLFVIPAFAFAPRTVDIIPRIEFSGSTATCYVTVMGEDPNDEIEAEISLKQGSRTVTTWTEEARGILVFEESVSATKGKTYTLYVDATINSVEQPTVTCSKVFS